MHSLVRPDTASMLALRLPDMVSTACRKIVLRVKYDSLSVCWFVSWAGGFQRTAGLVYGWVIKNGLAVGSMWAVHTVPSWAPIPTHLQLV